MSARIVAAAVVASACARRPPPEPLRNTAPSRLVAIEHVPGLAIPSLGGAARDCRPSQVVRRRFAGEGVIACGALGIDEPPAAVAAARTCVERALADGQPFVVEAEVQGIDSTVAYGLVGIVEHGVLATYRVIFDSDPCGGGCPDRGATTIDRCTQLARDVTRAEACAGDVVRCFRCDGARIVEQCRFGS